MVPISDHHRPRRAHHRHHGETANLWTPLHLHLVVGSFVSIVRRSSLPQWSTPEVSLVINSWWHWYCSTHVSVLVLATHSAHAGETWLTVSGDRRRWFAPSQLLDSALPTWHWPNHGPHLLVYLTKTSACVAADQALPHQSVSAGRLGFGRRRFCLLFEIPENV
jgi:hypothetical protein